MIWSNVRRTPGSSLAALIEDSNQIVAFCEFRLPTVRTFHSHQWVDLAITSESARPV